MILGMLYKTQGVDTIKVPNYFNFRFSFFGGEVRPPVNFLVH